jgi:hypothetical protein
MGTLRSLQLLTSYTCCTLVAFMAPNHETAAQTDPTIMDIGVFPKPGDPNTLQVRIRPENTFSGLVSQLTFTLRWETASGANLGTINQNIGPGAGSCPAVVAPLSPSGDGEVDVLGFRYQTYNCFSFTPIGSCPFVTGYTWPGGVETIIAEIPILNNTGCANFNIVNDSYTGPANKDFFISLGGFQDMNGVIYSPFYPNGNCPPATYVDLAARAMLDGPYVDPTPLLADADGLMSDNLRVLGLIPAAQPYNSAPFNYAGTETVAPAVLAATGPNAIVDWVLLELRDKMAPSSIVARRAALVQRDGDIVDVDGTSPVRFLNMPADQYHIAVRHRNHLAVMTASPQSLSPTPVTVDFRSTTFSNYGTSPANALNAQRVRDGRRVMWSGNVVHDGEVKYVGLNNDRDVILTAIGGLVPTNTVNNVYTRSDVTMDGQIKYSGLNNDRDPILVNIGGVIPTAVLLQQLP